MYSPTKEFLQVQHQMLLEQAKNARLLKQCSQKKPALHEQLLWHCGEALIALGYTLKRFSHDAASETSLPIYDMT